jgi:hypothetical protein
MNLQAHLESFRFLGHRNEPCPNLGNPADIFQKMRLGVGGDGSGEVENLRPRATKFLEETLRPNGSCGSTARHSIFFRAK